MLDVAGHVGERKISVTGFVQYAAVSIYLSIYLQLRASFSKLGKLMGELMLLALVRSAVAELLTFSKPRFMLDWVNQQSSTYECFIPLFQPSSLTCADRFIVVFSSCFVQHNDPFDSSSLYVF